MALPPFLPELSCLPPVPTCESSVQDLCARYSLSRQSLYPRLNAVGVTGERRAQRTFFTPAEVFQLDAAHFYLSQGYGLKEIACQVSGSVDSLPSCPSVVPAPSRSDDLALLGEVIAEVFSRRDSSPLDVYRQLAEAADQSFLLTTSVLASILGFSNSTIHGWNSVEERFGFMFRRQGQGRWLVSRHPVAS